MPAPRRPRCFDPVAVPAIALVALFAAGTFLPRHADLDPLFAFESFRTLGTPAFLLSSAALFLVLLPPLTRRLTAGLAWLGSRFPGRLAVPFLVVGFGAAFLLLTKRRLGGDGPGVLHMLLDGHVQPSNALTSDLHLLLVRLGLDALDAIRLLAVASGIVYVLTAIRIARESFPDTGRRATLAALLLTPGSLLAFFGELEVYAPLSAALALYLLVGLRHLAGKGRGVAPPLVLGTAFALHGSAGILLPSLLLLANDGRRSPVRLGRWFVWGLLFLVPVVAVFGSLFLFTWDGRLPSNDADRLGNFLGGMDQGPIPPLLRSWDNLPYRYALLDLERLLGVLNILLLAAPAGLAALLLGRPWRRLGRTATWLGTVAAALVLFPLIWNVNFPLRLDANLFAPVGIPLTLLGGLLLLRRRRGRRRGPAVVALGLYAFVPLVLSSTGDRADRLQYASSIARVYADVARLCPPRRAVRLRREAVRWEAEAASLIRNQEPLFRAERARFERRLPEAEAAYRENLRMEPWDIEARVELGTILHETGRAEEARAIFEQATRDAPWAVRPRMALGVWTLLERGPAEAVPVLQGAIRRGWIDPRIVESIQLLEHVYDMLGDARRAEAMARLVKQRRALGG
jgi:tetratricopeptide (TPR) repeat protein